MMKNLIYASLMTIAVGFMSSCSDIVEGLNDNPNQPSSTSPDLLLTGLQLGVVTWHMDAVSRDAGVLNGYFVGMDRQFLSKYNYQIVNADFNGHWANAYRVVRNAMVLEELAEEDNREGIIVGIAKVMRAHTLGTIAALWGDVPYTEAGRYAEYNNPNYDAQQDVYAGVQDILDEAIADLSSPVGGPVSNADLFFDGNPDRWTKVAYSLKARFYLHAGDYQNAYTNAQLGMTDPGDTWQADFFQDEINSENLYEQFYRGNRAEDLQTSGSYFFELLSPSGSAYRGDAKTDETARFNYLVRATGGRSINNTTPDGAFGVTAPYALVSYAENMLILAESAYHVNGFGSALDHLNALRAYYNTGAHVNGTSSTAGVLYDAYTANDFSMGGMAAAEDLNQEQSLLRKILEEKYVLFYSHIEGFIDVRRTITEPYAVPIPPNTGTQIPQRFLYPQTELDRNINRPDNIPSIYDRTPINE